MDGVRPPLRAPTIRALVSCAAVVVAVCLAGASAAVAAPTQVQPQKLWQKFPLNGQGTTSGPTATTPSERAGSSTTGDAGWSLWEWIGLAFGCVALALGLGVLVNERRKRGVYGSRRRVTLPSEHLSAWSDRLAQTDRLLARVRRSAADAVESLTGATARSRLARGLRGRNRRTPRAAESAGPARGLAHRRSSVPAPPARAGSDDRSSGNGRRFARPHLRHERGETGAKAEAPAAPEGRDRGGLVSIVRNQVDRAHRQHHAIALLAAGVGGSRADLGADDSELEHKVEAAASDAVGDAGPAECFVDREERIVWLVLPGVLPRRAAAASRHLRNLLDQQDIPVARLAVVGYPRDAKNADDLVARCRDVIDAFRDEEVAHEFAEPGGHSPARDRTAR